ncbi:unnamed protein product [Brassicogethes aeneus]|uniref:Uncharacterized protein n=1 Tax=Brassicogethes aeneus TaxID=1431903 RepID=A0A9P0B5U8_BRAAE|nr:unnamed protein product [Brassicogethes aeneus]
MTTTIENYEGSRLFAGLSKKTGVPIDQVNFFMTQLVALLLASVYRKFLRPSDTGTVIRHLYGLIVGFSLIYFCYGVQTLHLLSLSAAGYVILITQRPQVLHVWVFAVSMTYLSVMHVYRMYANYGGTRIDISGPLMVLVQKLTSLAFSVHDGYTKTEEAMTETQKKLAITAIPSPLEYFSYVLLFPSVMAGPIIYYNDYMGFIEGSDGSSNYSPSKIVLKKVLIACSCCAIFVICNPFFPIAKLKTEWFLESTTISYKFFYLSICTMLARFKYYFAWIIADAICNNSGIGFNGLNSETRQAKWDKVSNIDIYGFEFATSLKDAITAWNKGTNVWLRFIVYERVEKNQVLLTYGLSAVWHGFHPGYYMTFFGGAIFTQASRIIRKNVRSYFVTNVEMKKMYDIMTFLVTRFMMAYVTFPFILLEFWASAAIYNKLYWHLHIAALFVIILVPNCLPRTLAANPVKNEDNVKLVKALRSGSYRID